jgi:outer membrane receptor protein involved in Fe transport
MKVMKKFGLLILLVLPAFVWAQFPGQGAPNGKAGMNMNMGHIFGKVVDSSGKAISDVSVIVLQKKFDSVSKKAKEVLVKGTSTKSNGEFDLDELPAFGELKLKISATGYTLSEQSISFMSKPGAGGPGTSPSQGAQGGMPGPGSMPNFDKDMGKIKLAADVRQLTEVTIVASKPLVKLEGDKKVFNVEKNIVSAGGTALDVMKNVPSVNVDIDGNVSVRNSAPTIYVDGRPTTLTLDQIPADAIESVEVITNPSAKYDAAGGSGGILNIVLKKNRKTGYNGNVRAGVDKRGAMNAGGDFNLRQGKFNFNASLMASQNKGVSTGNTDRTNLLDTPQTHIYQSNYNKTNGGFIFGKLGLDYLVSNKTTLSLAAIRVHGEFKPYETIDINTDSLYNTGKTSSYSNRISNSERIFNGGGVVFGMKHTFDRKGEEWTIDGNLFGGKNSNASNYTTNYYSAVTGDIVGTDLQKVTGNGSDRNIVVQTDYVRPLSTKTKLEAGLRAALRSRKNIQDNYIYDPNTGDYELISAATSNYKNNDDVYAAYATISSSFKNFSYKLGLRAESSNYSGELINTKDQFKNSYPISLFPSVYLSQKLSESQTLTLNYSRRVTRPNFFQLIPYTDYTDKLNITRGNPELVPEFTQSFEMAYLKTYKRNTFLASLYYKHTDNLITRFIDQEENPLTGQPVLINTYINANSSYSAGAEFTAQNYLNKWWDISTNVNIYNSKINTDNVTESQPAMWSWFGKFNSNFKLPAKFTTQLSATYQSKTNLVVNSGGGMMGPPGFGQAQSSSQGYIAAFWGVDLAIKKTFLKNDAASVTLSVSDIFRSRINTQHSESMYFVQDYSRIRDPQMVRLNFAYRFGKMDVSLFKRKSQGTGESIQQ